MIPKKGTSEEDINQSLNNDLQKSEEQAAEAMKTNKPALYRSMAQKGIQFVILGVTVLGIGYKMFFADIKKSFKKDKIEEGKIPSLGKQEQLAKTSISKSGKALISEKKTIALLDKSSDDIERLKVPKLELPILPDTSLYQEVKTDLFGADKKKEEEKKNENPLLSSIQNPMQSQTLDGQMQIQQGSMPTMPNSSPMSDPNMKKNDEKISFSSINSPFASKKEETIESKSKTAIESMFVLSGSGPATQNIRYGSPGGRKNDFILFEGSSLSVREVSNENVTTQRLGNLETTIATGKIIEAVLETAINSEMPGIVRAVVSKDVIGEMGSKILVPMGSRLYGTYSTATNHGQTRLAIIWNKVLRPDGVVVTVNAQAVDQFGRAGLDGEVDSRYMEMFQNSMFLSFITLGTAIAMEKVMGIGGQTQVVNTSGTITNTNMTPANVAAQSIVTTAADIAKEMSKGLMEKVKPIISIPQGLLLKVMVNQEIQIPPYNRRVTDFDR